MASPSNNRRSDGRLPVPVSITLYNRLPPLDEDEGTAGTKKKSKYFRPDYTVSLLVSIRLEIVLLLPAEGEERILYSSQINQSTIHAVWDHLNERVKEWNGSSKWEAQSQSTILRILLLENNAASPGGSRETVLIDSIPLNPHSLRRLPNKDDDHHQENDHSFSYNDYGEERTPPPAALPPNAVLIHYTDGLVRVEGSLYHILLQKQVIEEVNPRDIRLLQDDDQEEKRRLRFHDNVFDVLDQAAPKPAVSIVTTTGSLLETDNEALATPVRTVEEGEFFNDDNVEAPVEAPVTPSLGASPPSLLVDEVQMDIQDLKRERNELARQLQEEETLFQRDQEQLQEYAEQLQAMRTYVDDTQHEVSQIREATSTVLQDQHNLAFSMTLFQRKLVQELQQIYPITIKGQPQAQQHQLKRYCIAGAEMPLDLFWGHAINEDEVSAALGFVAHALVLLSKYLAVALRHRMVCNSSRSAIQDDGTSTAAMDNGLINPEHKMEILPLFLGRLAERQQLERGMILLHRNVDCLAKSQGMMLRNNNGEGQQQQQQPQQQHLLAKLQQVFDNVIQGR